MYCLCSRQSIAHNFGRAQEVMVLSVGLLEHSMHIIGDLPKRLILLSLVLNDEAIYIVPRTASPFL